MNNPLPPLNALKAFEAAARTGGYVTAARELGVSPAAVSQQVKNLEQFFAKQLFVRYNNRLALSDAGLAVFADAARIFERLAEMTVRVFEGEVRSRLVISVLSSLAQRWLNRHIASFLAQYSEIGVDVRVEDDPVDFSTDNIDVRLCYGRHLYPELASTSLIHDEVLPLCTPALADRFDGEASADELLIHTSWGPSFASHPTWGDWYKAAGISHLPDPGRGHRVGQSSLAIDLALGGAGIALGQRLLARDDIASGKLVAPVDHALALGHPYCAVHAHARAQKPGLAAFVDWTAQKMASQTS